MDKENSSYTLHAPDHTHQESEKDVPRLPGVTLDDNCQEVDSVGQRVNLSESERLQLARL